MEKQFIRFATRTARAAGSPWTFLLCLTVVVIWAVTGPLFRFSNGWQLFINTGTTIVTFLMVFLIQNTQNRDAAAMHAKLDELVYATHGANNRFVGIEHLTDRELSVILGEVEQRAREIHAERRARLKKETTPGTPPPRESAGASSPRSGRKTAGPA
jgi:low affinity Fe/Cu permease